MVAASRSSLMFLQSDFSKPSVNLQDSWHEELDRKRQSLKKRCKELDTVFGNKISKEVQLRNSTIGDGNDTSARYIDSVHEKRCPSCTPKSNPKVYDEQRHNTPGVDSKVSDIYERCRYVKTPVLERSTDRHSSLTRDIPDSVPLRLWLACQADAGNSTPSCNRSLILLDPPAKCRRKRTGFAKHLGRHFWRDNYRRYSSSVVAPKSHHKCNLKHQKRYWNFPYCKDRFCPKGDSHSLYKNRYYKMDTPMYRDRLDISSSVDDTDCASPDSRAVVTPGNSDVVARTMQPRIKIDSNYIDRLLSGQSVSLDVLKAPELGSSEAARYTISICREVFMAAIGAQMVYVVTSLMFGNVAAAIIVSLLCLQSALCHCDGRPMAYVINGVLSMLVGTTVTVALCRDVSGLEPYRRDPVLNTMSYIYVPLCFCFGIFSFYLAHSNYDLQKQERRAIVHAVNRLLGERYRVNERNLGVERST
ncbi:uncharacterized protein BXIN_1854 [Babesia sp. Xinjiang]|uniref:uncharacterized protein n=1 Tax=Babesia sp. Xinjiang TaxID=462227 RepID=UPI000A257CF0|nr:uncharacterized protein BXIN_1854 [Babesia sp. Xinjiang]ORM40432.1 hypothetical protein BXIN_1854 [Babesia sp. Xinjiang]